MKFLRPKDTVKIDLGEIAFKLSPLSFWQRADIESCKKIVSGEEIEDQNNKTLKLLKYSVKSITGVKLYDGSDYEVQFDDSGNLTDECAGEIALLPCKGEIFENITRILLSSEDEIDPNSVEVEKGKQ